MKYLALVLALALVSVTSARRSTGLDSYCNTQMQTLGWDSCPHGFPLLDMKSKKKQGDRLTSPSNAKDQQAIRNVGQRGREQPYDVPACDKQSERIWGLRPRRQSQQSN